MTECYDLSWLTHTLKSNTKDCSLLLIIILIFCRQDSEHSSLTPYVFEVKQLIKLWWAIISICCSNRRKTSHILPITPFSAWHVQVRSTAPHYLVSTARKSEQKNIYFWSTYYTWRRNCFEATPSVLNKTWFDVQGLNKQRVATISNWG